MSDLREDLDRALRALPVSPAPVERARRDGRRLRTRRRAAVLAGAVAVAAVAAGYPALSAGTESGPMPTTQQTVKPAPTQTALTLPNGDPVITDQSARPGMVPGDLAQGTIGAGWWQVIVRQPGAANPVPGDPCFTFTYSSASTDGSCNDLSTWLSQPPSQPVEFTGTSDGTTGVTIGQIGQDVDYAVLTFTDGQQLKLIPVTLSGERYVAWAAPLSMTVARVDAHLGGPDYDSGESLTAIPFVQPGQPSLFGLWQPTGQAGGTRAHAVIGRGTNPGPPWSVAAYEGPWGTCFVVSQAEAECVPVLQLTTTTVLGGWTGSVSAGAPVFGSAAAGVAVVQVKLSDGSSLEVKPVAVGNERLFAGWLGKGLTPTSWKAYSAGGKQIGAGTVNPASELVPGSS